MNELKRQLELATEQLEQWIRDTQPIIGWRDTVTFAATKTLITDCKAVLEAHKSSLKIFTCTDHEGFWNSLGVATVVIVKDEKQARDLVRTAVIERGIVRHDPDYNDFTLQELNVSKPKATILRDGEYV